MLKTLLCAAVLSTALFSSAAMADQNDIRLLNDAKISLAAAITAAEKHHAGSKAMDAGIDDDHSTPTYDVTVVKDGVVHDVLVNGMTGEIITSTVDHD